MYNLGDVLKVQYSGFRHYGIYVGDGIVIHNSKKFKKVEEISIEDFSDGKQLSISSNIKTDNPELAVQAAKKYVGVPYQLFTENCEHFVRLSCGLVKESTQIQKYLIVALIMGAFLKSDNTTIKAAGGVAAIASILTPTEKSPVKNALIFGLLTAGILYMATDR